MSDARDLVEQYASEAWYTGESVATPLTTNDFAPRAFAALRAVLDKCDELDQTDHLVARAFAREFRYRIADALLAGDPR